MISLTSKLQTAKGGTREGGYFLTRVRVFARGLRGGCADFGKARVAVAPLQDPQRGALLGMTREEVFARDSAVAFQMGGSLGARTLQ